MTSDRSEIYKGWQETRRYLLSHHEESELYRCYKLRFSSDRVHLCARCSGIYPGIALGFLAYFYAPAVFSSLILVAVFPLPALLDWAYTSLRDYKGYNFVRTVTGALLGYGYGLGLAHLFLQTQVGVLGIGVVYGLAAGSLLYLDSKR